VRVTSNSSTRPSGYLKLEAEMRTEKRGLNDPEIKKTVAAMDRSRSVSGGIVARAVREGRKPSEAELKRGAEAIEAFDEAFAEFRKLTGLRKEFNDEHDSFEDRDTNRRHAHASYVKNLDRYNRMMDDDDDFVPGARSLDGDPDFEERGFGQGGACETRKWDEVMHRSGVEGDAWGGEGNGFRDSTEYFSALASQRHDPRLQKRAQSTFPDSDGGFAVPTPLAREIFDTALEGEIVRPRARVFVMGSQTLQIPSWDGSDHSSDTVYSGITSSWKGEATELDVKTTKMRAVELKSKKFALLGRVSTELAEDSPTFAREFTRALTDAAGWHLDNAFLNGNGTTQPQGLLDTSNPALVTVAKESGQSANTILFENIVAMWSRLWPRGHSNAVWIANHDIIPQLYMMSQAIGTAGVPVYMPANGAAGTPFASLFGRPLLFSEKVPTLGTAGDVGLYDLSQYALGIRAEIALMISPHVYFSSDELAFRLRVRVDGKSLWDSAITPAKGANTLSPFVTLATRA